LSLRFQEKGNLEVLLFTIQSRMRANNQRVYTPKEGALVSDINRVRFVSDTNLHQCRAVLLRKACLCLLISVNQHV